MKILFASQVPDSRLLGVPRVLYCVGDVLQFRGHTVEYFWESDAPDVSFKQAALIEWGMRAAPRIGERCKRERYDVVVITTASGWCLGTFRNMLLPAGTKIVSSHHGWEELMWVQMLTEEKLGGQKFSARFKLYYGGMILWALRQSLRTQDGFVFTSSEEAEHVRRQYPGVANRCKFIANGVSGFYLYPERFESPPATEGPVRLLFVGYWDPWRKGRKYLVEAFDRLIAEGASVTLTLAGTKLGPDAILPEFSEAARARINVVPQASEDELNMLYRSHDVFVLPSLFEGMPLVMLEAMASGMPCVTTDNNGMHDVIETGVNGILIPRRNADALTTALGMLVANPDARRQMGQAAQQLIKERYSWETVGLEWEKFLQSVVEGTLQQP